MYIGLPGRGGGGEVAAPPPPPPGPRHADSDGASAATLLRPLLCTMGIVPASSAAPNTSDYSLSPSPHTPPPAYCQVCGMASMPVSPYSAYLSGGQPGQRGLQVFQMTSAASPVGSTRRVHFWRISTPPVPVSTCHPPPIPPPPPSLGGELISN